MKFYLFHFQFILHLSLQEVIGPVQNLTESVDVLHEIPQ